MIHDAASNPLGLHIPIAHWPKHPLIRQLSRQRGFRVPAPNFVEPNARPALAFLNHGVWKGWCPDCIGSAEELWRGGPFFCMRCGNASAGGSWRPVAWPANIDEIEASLDGLSPDQQNWETTSDA